MFAVSCLLMKLQRTHCCTAMNRYQGVMSGCNMNYMHVLLNIVHEGVFTQRHMNEATSPAMSKIGMHLAPRYISFAAFHLIL